ncbi:MAG: polyamine ABC transporter ATP-binding protein [Streptosporangiales bacterium]|nr:polyamine ABC transporter ATP-binding protein [Streptosporangiales bacterium]
MIETRTAAEPSDLPGTHGEQAVPAIQLAGVTKEFSSRDGDVAAVRGVDLTMPEGAFFSLLGPSGCGKTTTLRMIAGFEEPTAGQVFLHGRDVTQVPANRRDVNMVFQSYALFPHMSIFDNVAFGLRRKNVPRDEIRSRVGEMLDIVDLTGREQRRPRELSGGQQQRVALARALVNGPRALLLDEPLGALDLKLRQAMQVELKRIQRETKVTFVYVTHDQGEALTMSDQIAVMNDGLVEQLGTPAEIYEYPATKFVAGFIGTSNLLDGTAQQVTGELATVSYGDEQLTVALPAGRSAVAGDRLELTVRPEKIEISTQPVTASSDLCVLRGTVAEVVYLGTSTNYSVTTRAGDEVVVFQQNASSAQTAADRGDDVWLSWHSRHSYAIGSTES